MIAELSPGVDSRAVSRDANRYHSLGAALVDPVDLLSDCSATETAQQELMITVVKALVGHFNGKLCDACKYEPNDIRFQRPAEYLLRALAPNFLQLYLASEPVPDHSYSNSRKTKSGVPQDDHGPGIFFWFRECLILLSTQLDSEKHLRANVSRVISHIKAKRPHLQSCTALIWSTRHVIGVRIAHGRVVHTTAQPVLAAYGLPVLAAYGVDDGVFSTSVRLLAHFLRPVRIGLANEGSKENTSPFASWQASDTAIGNNEGDGRTNTKSSWTSSGPSTRMYFTSG